MRKYKLAARHSKPSDSFTLVELLVVIAIIAILAALILGAGNGVMIKGMRSRASAEIQAISTAAEGYKTDNGIYPQGDGNLTTNGAASYTSDDGTTPGPGGEYQTNGALLYLALTGQTNYGSPPLSGTKVYLPLKANQVGNPAGALNGTFSYIMDPWRHAYGYSTGTPIGGTGNASYPYNGGGFFDLWSTGGATLAKPNTNSWISNWTQ